MKFSAHWLRSFVQPAMDDAGLEQLLTMAGLEVESCESAAPAFSGVVVGHIVSIESHPDADRLRVCRVDVGAAHPLQIVCGAPNARAGMKVPCAQVGAELPGISIRAAKVRGVESAGMLCSSTELGLTASAEGLLELPQDVQVGCDIRACLDLDDCVYTLKLTPNRSDCMSVLGVAREVSALTGTPLQLPEMPVLEATTGDRRDLLIEDPSSCPRYCGRVVRGVRADAPTPDWMRRRLERSGVRGINALVDVTNYVMLELGQPLHAFDNARMSGAMQVRLAHAGETLELLDGQNITLQPDMLVIADERGPLALAGIMGGAGSAVAETTSDVFLESAFFSPAAIAGRARRLGLNTDASSRFERGVDAAGTRVALERATQLILDICGGSAGPVTESGRALPARPPIRFRTRHAAEILGIELDAEVVSNLFQRLQFAYEREGETFRVTPPSYRFDMAIEEDLIEEVARLYGYARIPAILPHTVGAMLPEGESGQGDDEVRHRMVAAGYREAITYSFVDAAWERDLQGNTSPVALRNPIASHMSVMRSGLWGGLLDALVYNLNRKQDRVRLFEIGACFRACTPGYAEALRVAGIAYGSALPEQWGEAARPVDFYDIKADVESLLPASVRFEPASHPALHPGQSARVLLEGKPIGHLGGLHPRWQQRAGIPGAVMLFELDLSALLRAAKPSVSGISRFPPVRRDLALVVDEAIPAQALLDALRAAAPREVEEIALFDQYRGKGVGCGKKSLAFRIVMQDTQKTLADEESQAVVAALLQRVVKEFNAELRS